MLEHFRGTVCLASVILCFEQQVPSILRYASSGTLKYRLDY